MCGYNTVVGMVKGMIDTLGITVPVALHLDHGSYEGAKAVIRDGFSSVMFDGSHYGIEENIEKTKEIIALAAEKGLSVEAEVGAIGGEEDGVVGKGEVADADECKLIADLGVTMLAAGIGNIHGKYPANWAYFDFNALKLISEKTNGMPLVLHGGTGIPADMIKKGNFHGSCENQRKYRVPARFCRGNKKIYRSRKKTLRARALTPESCSLPGFEAIKATVKEKNGTVRFNKPRIIQ